MIGLLCLFLALVASPFKSKSRLEAENAVLRHQLIVLRRKARGRVRLTNNGRWFFIQLYRWFPSILNVLTIIRPETLVRPGLGFRYTQPLALRSCCPLLVCGRGCIISKRGYNIRKGELSNWPRGARKQQGLIAQID
jgi:hypothetical protein